MTQFKVLIGQPFATPQPLRSLEALETAKKHFEQWMPSAQQFLYYGEDAIERTWNNKAAFFLHQSVEAFYTYLLLVRTNYNPNSHNIKFLRSLVEQLDSCLY